MAAKSEHQLKVVIILSHSGLAPTNVQKRVCNIKCPVVCVLCVSCVHLALEQPPFPSESPYWWSSFSLFRLSASRTASLAPLCRIIHRLRRGQKKGTLLRKRRCSYKWTREDSKIDCVSRWKNLTTTLRYFTKEINRNFEEFLILRILSKIIWVI